MHLEQATRQLANKIINKNRRKRKKGNNIIAETITKVNFIGPKGS